MYDKNTTLKPLNEKEKDLNNINITNIANNNTHQNHLNLNQALSKENRIYIHKPSDFLKNKYPFFGNLSNKKDLLSMDSRKTYHSHKFNMKDFKQQMKKSNQIIKSIIESETKILPNLLKNYPGQNNINTIGNYYEAYVVNPNNNSTIYNKSNYDTGILNYNNGLNSINLNKKNEKLVNLKFSVGSPRRNNIIPLHGILGNKNIKPISINQKNYNSLLFK